MAIYRDQGIVLRTYKLGETDRILHLLTQGRGKVRAVAKGVRRPGSRFGGRLEPYGHVDLQFYEGRNLDVINQAELIAAHANVRSDFGRSAAAAVMAESIDAVTVEQQRNLPAFMLLRAGLRALDAQPPDPSVFVDAFLIRVAAVSGYHLFVDACSSCRSPGRHPYFSIAAAGVLCGDCAPQGVPARSPAVLDLVALFASTDWVALAHVTPDRPERVEAAQLVREFFETSVERRLKALEHVPRGSLLGAR